MGVGRPLARFHGRGPNWAPSKPSSAGCRDVRGWAVGPASGWLSGWAARGHEPPPQAWPARAGGLTLMPARPTIAGEEYANDHGSGSSNRARADWRTPRPVRVALP